SHFAAAHWRLGEALTLQGKYTEALAEYQQAIELGSFEPYVLGGVAFAQAKSGNREAALKIVKDLEERSKKEYVPQWAIAAAYAGLGDTKSGIASLNKGIDAKDLYIPENFFEPLLEPLRRDPAFGAVTARMWLESKQ
ncbi:MAG TPA: tetratricopeptide repeat protein, partial [Gemmatimonadales bacterium]|nr:tetratricopeptide repeat protein [Gemmatimonadales bacterium]